MADGYYGRRGTAAASFVDGFTLSPLPYPVLLILAVISIFLGIQWFSAYEDAVESAEEQTNWALLAAPILLLIAVRCLSSFEDPGSFFSLFGFSSYGRLRHSHSGGGPSEGGSPWGVAALIVLLLVLVQFQSSFLDSWLV